MKLPKNVTSTEWERFAKRLITQATVCAICGQPLQPDARPRSRWSTSVDHIVPRAVFMKLPLAQQREFFLSPTNCRVVHATCNGRRGDGTTAAAMEQEPVPSTSRKW